MIVNVIWLVHFFHFCAVKQSLHLPLACFEPLGVANGLIPDKAMKASTSLDDLYQPYYGRIINVSSKRNVVNGCWCARKVDTTQYLEVDLRRSMSVTGKCILK